MKPYSLDLRRRVLDAWLRGEGSQRQLASRFSVHLTFVRNLLRLYRQSGSIEPRPHGGGRRSPADGSVLARLAQRVAERPDDTLDEHRQQLAGVAPEDLVFVDESGVNRGMTRWYARSP